MKIKIRPRLDAKLVADARALGLDISRIVDEALIREIEAKRFQRRANRTARAVTPPGKHEPNRAGR
jgi:post-segregation antitoxin (ccd killing protein)